MTTTNFSNQPRTTRVTVAVILTLALSALQLGIAPAVNAQAPAKGTESSSQGGPKEGIKVHGHWIIEVRNPDGTLVTRREFENAFIGGLTLTRILGRVSTVGLWAIQLGHSTGTGLPVNDNLGPWGSQLGIIEEPAYPFGAGGNISTNLSVSVLNVSIPFGAPNGLVLTGNIAAQYAGSINFVQTLVGTCSKTVPPGSCTQVPVQPDGFVTSKYPIDNPVSVGVGQIIQITVTITFS